MITRFLNDPTLFLHFCDYLPFEEDLTLDFVQFQIPFTLGWSVPSLIEIVHLVLENTSHILKKLKMGGNVAYVT
jgi:hypothetical protein